jgi:hypothetical protein
MQRFLPIDNAMVLLPALLQVIQQVIKRETDHPAPTLTATGRLPKLLPAIK